MKLLVVLALITIAFGASIEEEQRINGENGWYIPQVDGSFEWVSLKDAANRMSNIREGRASTEVFFYVYTKTNPTIPQKISASDDSVRSSNFNSKVPTIFVIHGWYDTYKNAFYDQVRDAWLSKGEYNIIAVDWSSRALTLNYFSSVYYVPAVGKLVAKFANYLHRSHGMSFSTLTVIGGSLGAHVAGFTGKNTMKQVDTIIGLDPALPLYSYDSPEKRLASTDGYYVESIQTNGGQFGFLKPIGKCAFYPNGGEQQPGCGNDGGCSHPLSGTYYAEAVSFNNFGSFACDNYTDAVKMDCGDIFSTVRMGALTHTNNFAGAYYVPVNAESPHGMLG